MTDALLTLSGVHTHIGRYHILQGVDFSVPKGGVTMLLGRNGAGKTTTLRTIMGLWQASQGAIHFDGAAIEKRATPDISMSGVAYVPETMAIFSDLTVRENLVLAARAGAPDEKRLEWIFGLFPALRKFWLSRAGTLSGGQQSRVALARVLLRARPLMLLDEPFAALGPALKADMLDLVAEIADETGATVLMVSHDPDDALSFSGQTVLVAAGVAHAPRPTAALFADPPPELAAYLGRPGPH